MALGHEPGSASNDFLTWDWVNEAQKWNVAGRSHPKMDGSDSFFSAQGASSHFVERLEVVVGTDQLFLLMSMSSSWAFCEIAAQLATRERLRFAILITFIRHKKVSEAGVIGFCTDFHLDDLAALTGSEFFIKSLPSWRIIKSPWPRSSRRSMSRLNHENASLSGRAITSCLTALLFKEKKVSEEADEFWSSSDLLSLSTRWLRLSWMENQAIIKSHTRLHASGGNQGERASIKLASKVKSRLRFLGLTILSLFSRYFQAWPPTPKKLFMAPFQPLWAMPFLSGLPPFFLSTSCYVWKLTVLGPFFAHLEGTNFCHELWTKCFQRKRLKLGLAQVGCKKAVFAPSSHLN